VEMLFDDDDDDGGLVIYEDTSPIFAWKDKGQPRVVSG
jgi:hypothetical protein